MKTHSSKSNIDSELLEHGPWAVAFLDLLGQKEAFLRADFMPDEENRESVEALLAAVRDSLGVIQRFRKLTDTLLDRSDETVIAPDSPLRGLSAQQVSLVRHVKRRRLRDLRWSDGTGETISASDETPSIPPTMVEAAPDDMGRVVTESLAVWSSKQKCWLAGQEMPCSQVRQGPFVVTDVIALPECTDSIYVGASLAAEESQRSGRVGFRWVVRAGHPGIHGARLVVKAGESLLVAISSSEGHVVEYPKCIATWSGYGPDRNPYRQ